jgi:flagellar hook-associated protein 1 FlgK
VRIGGRVVVQGESVEDLRFDRSAADAPTLGGRALQPVEVDGRIGGLLETRDVDLADAIRRLDELARDLADEVNAVHRQGTAADGRPAGDFFVMTRLDHDGVGGAAATLSVDPAVLDDADRIAAGSSGESGDNVVALDLAALRQRLGGPSGRLQALVVDFGARAKEAADLATGQGVIVQSFEAQRESVSGVSLDEEATNLLQFQRSYEAAARVMSIVDEMTQTLLSI